MYALPSVGLVPVAGVPATHTRAGESGCCGGFTGGVRLSAEQSRASRVVVVATIATPVSWPSGLVAAAATVAAPAGATTVAKDGLTSQTASPSCWSIKQSYPASTDGIYWLWTPKLVDPQQFYCDMTTDGGGWVLVGRGREAWTFPYWGQGSAVDAAQHRRPARPRSQPATLPTPTVDGLLNGGRPGRAPGRHPPAACDEHHRHHLAGGPHERAETFGVVLGLRRRVPAQLDLVRRRDDELHRRELHVRDQHHRQRPGRTRTFKKVTSYDVTAHNSEAGFAFGSSVTNGTNDPNNYLWEFANENSAIPFTQMFIRPKITDADIANAGVSYAPDSGTPASTVRTMLDRTPVSQGWAVTGINVGTAISNMNDYVKTFAQIGNVLYMGGKFLQVQHGIGGPTFTQSYLAAFDVNTGEWIPTFNPVINAPVWKIMASPDGTKLFVGGEFTSVNGQANTTALAALDPTTGAVVPSTSWQAYASRPTGSYDIRAMSIQGPWLYLGGNFTKITGGTGFNTAGPLNVGRLARVAHQQRPARLEVGPDARHRADGHQRQPARVTALYAVGTFTTLNGTALASPHETTVDTTTGALVPGLQPWVATPARRHRAEQHHPRGRRPRLPGRLAALPPLLRTEQLRVREGLHRPEQRRRLPGPRLQERDPLRLLPLRHRLPVPGHHQLLEPHRLHPGRPDQPDRRLRHHQQHVGAPRVQPDPAQAQGFRRRRPVGTLLRQQRLHVGRW